MKSKSIRYSIQNPCDESWNDMKPEVTGRFCGSCEKTVVDFTSMSDFLIIHYMEKHKEEKVCGRFTKPQLNRVYQLKQPVFTPTFDLRAVVLGLALTTFSAVHSFGQTEPQEPVKVDTTFQVEPVIVGKIAVHHFNHEKESKVSGTIWASRKDFNQIFVQLKDVNGAVLKTIHPDSKGNFSIDLNWKLNPASLNVSGPNYENQELYFSSVRSLSGIQINLLDEIEMIRGEILQGDINITED
ncbi:hypothetical protein [Fluviicola taffensis]|uniref:Uncharacterized protein n=1 Tax=Fluviicola taffensis (strain DSM 16823 / NCIMB 13979 / RW262) TaxID=755732 RepID=F2IJL0_FLUTR|nr:hypothetical protein [Fluviicola taffensis]AEA42898.1 hypothetical protein Fluta_0897 [Fluviicola taffensis DSM 16823]